MTATQRRQSFRRILTGNTCVNPASVFDPVSAGLAQRLGYESAVLPGSIAAATVLGVPDLVLLTLPELTEQVQRMTRYCDVPLIVDADHGYGNALNTIRAVEELERAGAAALTLEDTLLPDQYKGTGEGMVTIGEMTGKLKAALKARSDPSLVIAGRTNALRSTNVNDAAERLKAYADAGVDAVMVVGVRAVAEVEAVRKATTLPIILGNVAANAPAGLVDQKALAGLGVRVAYQGQAPFLAGLKATYEALKHLREGGAISGLADKVATDDFFNIAVRRDIYAAQRKEFMA